MNPVVATIPTTMRTAFIGADIKSASVATVSRVKAPLIRGVGLIRRRKLWNKTFSDGPRPKRR